MDYTCSSTVNTTLPEPADSDGDPKISREVLIIIVAAGGFIIIAIPLTVILIICCKRRKKAVQIDKTKQSLASENQTGKDEKDEGPQDEEGRQGTDNKKDGEDEEEDEDDEEDDDEDHDVKEKRVDVRANDSFVENDNIERDMDDSRDIPNHSQNGLTVKYEEPTEKQDSFQDGA